MLQRNLLYTGVTRGKRLVVLVGQRRRPSRLQFATLRGGDAGRNLTSGFGSARPTPFDAPNVGRSRR